MRELFSRCGDVVIEDGAPDLIVINSCAVTAAAERGAAELASRLRKKYPTALIALVGCYGEVLKRNRAASKDFDAVYGNVDKYDIVDDLSDGALAGGQRRSADKRGEPLFYATGPIDTVALTGAQSRSARYTPFKDCARAFLHVQNGCDCGCAFCVVPQLRGRSASRPAGMIMRELDDLLARGYREVMLSGINIGLYKYDGYDLLDLISMLDAVSELEGIHLCSLEPISLNDRFIEGLAGAEKLRPHFHLSLQSGCDDTLSRMNRKYTFERYYSLMAKIRASVRDAAVSTDVIAGFPGESDADFMVSCENIAACQFSDIHIFKYSVREGTKAAEMQGRISAHRIDERANFLEGVKLQACYNYNSRFVGSRDKILILKKRSPVLAEGVNAYGIRTVVSGPGASGGDYASALITGLGKGCGSLVGMTEDSGSSPQ